MFPGLNLPALETIDGLSAPATSSASGSMDGLTSTWTGGNVNIGAGAGQQGINSQTVLLIGLAVAAVYLWKRK